MSTISIIRSNFIIMFLIALSFAFVTGAKAQTPAFAIQTVTLKTGPGNNYQDGLVIAKTSAVSVERCHKKWCLINSSDAKGWIYIDNLTFGVEARGPFSGSKLYQPLQGSGEVCFFSGENFSGSAVCSKTGRVVRDLAIFGIDNSFASISIDGDISVMVCSDFDFSSYCETILSNKPQLNRFLKRAISSYRVW